MIPSCVPRAAGTPPVERDAADTGAVWVVPPLVHELSERQLAAIHTAMRGFVEDDLRNGVSAWKRMVCDACHETRPLPGFIQYESAHLCNDCAIDYEIARVRGVALTIGQFVREQTFAPPDGATLDPGSDRTSPAPIVEQRRRTARDRTWRRGRMNGAGGAR